MAGSRRESALDEGRRAREKRFAGLIPASHDAKRPVGIDGASYG